MVLFLDGGNNSVKLSILSSNLYFIPIHIYIFRRAGALILLVTCATIITTVCYRRRLRNRRRLLHAQSVAISTSTEQSVQFVFLINFM
jgi:hypothetical protein